VAEFRANKLNMNRTVQSIQLDAAAIRENI
jgi:hypothetical protein